MPPAFVGTYLWVRGTEKLVQTIQKLSGILDTLELRILESEKNELDYKTFLPLLLQDELDARQTRKVQRLIQAARFGHE